MTYNILTDELMMMVMQENYQKRIKNKSETNQKLSEKNQWLIALLLLYASFKQKTWDPRYAPCKIGSIGQKRPKLRSMLTPN